MPRPRTKGLYVSTQFKNGSDVMKCLASKKQLVVKPESTRMPRIIMPMKNEYGNTEWVNL